MVYNSWIGLDINRFLPNIIVFILIMSNGTININLFLTAVAIVCKIKNTKFI